MTERIITRVEEYDSTTGSYSRKVKGSDVANLSVVAAFLSGGEETLTGSIVIDTDEIGLITNVAVSGTSSLRYQISVSEPDGDRVVMPIFVDDKAHIVPGGLDNPIAIAASGSTITQIVEGPEDEVVNAAISVLRIPNKDILETE